MKWIGSLVLILFIASKMLGACKEPFSLKYSEITSRSITISWVDNNNPILGYQLAYGEKGVALSATTKTPVASQKFRKLDNLTAGTAYVFWIRAVCAAADTSKWAGPVSFVTAIDNNASCELNLELRDNNCDNGLTDFFNIEVNLPPSATPYKLQSVSMIATHTWPADLLIQLESPQGNRIILTDRHGTVDDNYGIPGADCSQPSVFSDEACLSIAEGFPPFAGSYQPDEALSELNIPANPSGLWKLIVCDGAANDKGILKFVYLNFVEEPCNTVESFFISKITNTAFEISWNQPSSCKNLEIHYQKKGQPGTARTVVVNCNLQRYLVPGLEPDVEYEFYLVSSCLTPLFSVPSCVRTLKTSCTNVNLLEGFEDYLLCQQSCEEACDVDNIFKNIKSDDTDWLVNEGETPTDFTGPSSGYLGGGKYVYIESSPALCKTNMTAILETSCLKSGVISSGCDLDFAYHMYGKDIGSLNVEVSTDNKTSWHSIFLQNGDKGNQWNKAIQAIEVPPSTLFTMRFSGQTSEGSEGDIALDLITLGNVSTVESAIYYLDSDADGYGNPDQFVRKCDSKVPVGYSLFGGDCDDTNPNINPGKPDIPCNQIDENCDGVLVLTDTSNPMQIQNLVITDETCNGKGDGTLAIDVTGGSPPIQFNWLHGATGNYIDQLTSGFYKCKITDVNGCGLETSFIEIKSVSNFQAVVESIQKPTCVGLNDGQIKINHNGIYTPFKYRWSRGDTTLNLVNVSAGTYYVTITNGIGCVKELGPIDVTPASALQPVITFVKPPLCYGDATGILEINVVNGIPPYTFEWEDGFVGNRRTSLLAGTYHLTITDGVNCSQIYNPTLPGPDSLELDVTNLEDVRCFGTRTGQIRIHVAGGTSPYSYSWNDNGPLTQFRPNLTAGNYSVTIYDNNGCSAQKENIIVREPPQLFYSIDNVIPAGCLQKMDGAIYTTVFGGLPPYKYFWTGTNQNREDIIGLLPKVYTLTAVDAGNCKITTESITVPSGNIAYTVDILKLTDNICPSDQSAKIAASCFNGRSPLDFNWSNGTQRMIQGPSDTLDQLSGGNYRVTITDADGCISQSGSIAVAQIPAFNYSIDLIKNLCNSDSTGAIALTVNGATKPYLISWSNQQIGNKIQNLKNGLYFATVSDAKDCKLVVGPLILPSTSDIIVNVEKQDASPGQNSGYINITPLGGQGNYTISWQPPAINGFNPSNLPPGTYYYKITDELGCSVENSVTIDVINFIDQLEASIVMSPVPAHDYLEVQLPFSIENMKVFAFNGIEMTLNLNLVGNNKYILDTSAFPAGLYAVQFLSSGIIRTARFIKI